MNRSPSAHSSSISEICLAYEGLHIAVRGSSDAHLRWLAEFMTPHFQIDADARADALVTLREDDEAYHELSAAGPPRLDDEIDCFALDSNVIRLPIWNSSELGTTVFDEYHRVFYRVSGDGRRIDLLTPRDNLSLRIPLMRVVRELAMNHCHARGGLFLHASAVAFAGRGLIITGPKAAGKTTLLVHLLLSGNTAYVANDRVLVGTASQPIVVRGLASVVTVRPLTLELFPSVGRRLRASGFRSQITLDEAARQPSRAAQQMADGRFAMTPAQMCALADASMVAACPLAAVVFPRITESPGGLSLQPLSPEDAARRLPPSLLGAGTWKKTSDFFTLQRSASPGPSPAALARMCQVLADQVPCFEASLGLGAYESSDCVDQLRALASSSTRTGNHPK